MSKTRTASQRPHRLAPDVGGGGYLSNLEFRVKSFFSKLFEPERRTRKNPNCQSGRLLEKLASLVNRLFEETSKHQVTRPYIAPLNSCEILAAMFGAALLMK